MIEILKLKPYFSQRLWGGTDLDKKFGFKLPDNKKYGEAWLISALENQSSYIIKDNQKIYLNQYYNNNKILFDNNDNNDVFPMLSKIITPNDYLSIQVHPNDDYAIKKHSMLGKPECWYIIDAPKDSYLIYGHNAKTKIELEQYVNEQKWDQLFKKVKVNKGDFLYIPTGKIHALAPKVSVFELQRSSDVTYRFYDFDRKDENGNLRELHLNDSINVTTVPDSKDYIIRNANGLVIDSNEFTLYVLKESFNKEIKNIKWAQITVLEGEAKINNKILKKSESAILFNDNDKWDIEVKGICLFSYKR